MLKYLLICLPLLLLSFVPSKAHTLLGFDTSTPFLDQDFYDCVAGRLNWNKKAFAIVPYDPSGDFADEVTKAKKAGFREVHLLLDPETFPFVDVRYLPQQLLEALQGKGTFVAGFWVKVRSGTRFWRRTGSSAKNKLESLLSAFGDVFSQYGGLSVGVYTTSDDWKKVIGTPFEETKFDTQSQSQFKYWSAFDDNESVCNTADIDKSICHIQQIQYSNSACGEPFNVNIKRFKEAVEDL